MVIEFLGLPGSGKSTFEAELIHFIREDTGRVWEKNELVRSAIKEQFWSHYCQEHPARRLMTLSYKMALAADGFGKSMWRVNPYWPFYRHLMVPGMRLSEDLRLCNWLAHKEQKGLFYSLSEGLVHHLCAILSWQELLGKRKIVSDAWLQDILSVNSPKRLACYVHAPIEVAYQRLLSRGVPDVWPRYVEVMSVLKCFAHHTERLLSLLDSIDNTTVVQINNDVSSLELSRNAKLLAQQLLTDSGRYRSRTG